jgi:hypothetical protein
MPNFQGVWNLSEQYQAIGSQNWPMAPGAPTGVSASAGDQQATVSFTAPTFQGVPPNITQYRVTSNPGAVTETGSASPITVTGLSNGTSYTFSVQATNGVQFGPAGVSGSVTPELPDYGLFAYTGFGNAIVFINIKTLGNSQSFGELGPLQAGAGGCSSSTRGVFGGGTDAPFGGSYTNVISFVTFASAGNSSDFGDLTAVRAGVRACSSSTRGVFGGGFDSVTPRVNIIDYVTIASAGNAVDFGDMIGGGNNAYASCGSSTRGVFAGGSPSGTRSNVIQFVTIASTGDATDFGDLTSARNALGGCSNSTRGVFAGGFVTGPGLVNTIDYITIASAGNAVDFGDLLDTDSCGGVANDTRAVFGRGSFFDFVTIASTGNAADFGDAPGVDDSSAVCSSAHGGLA